MDGVALKIHGSAGVSPSRGNISTNTQQLGLGLSQYASREAEQLTRLAGMASPVVCRFQKWGVSGKAGVPAANVHPQMSHAVYRTANSI
jgi:hypothetical protein